MEEKEATLVLPIAKMNPQASLCWEQLHCPAHKGLHSCFTYLKSQASFRHEEDSMDTATCPTTWTGNHNTQYSVPWQQHRTSTANQPQVSSSQGLSCKGAATALHRQVRTQGPLQHDSQPIPSCRHSYSTKHAINLSMAFLPAVHYRYQLPTQRYPIKTYRHLSCGLPAMCNQYAQITIPRQGLYLR